MNTTWKYARNLCKFVLLGLLAGVVCGGVGTAFYHAVALATRLRKAHPWLLYLLPVAGLPFFALAAAVSFACSGRHSLYSAQSFVFDKVSV